MKNNILHMSDKNKLAIVISKVSGFNYINDGKQFILRIFMTSDIDPFVCMYPSLEALLSDMERLEKNININL